MELSSASSCSTMPTTTQAILGPSRTKKCITKAPQGPERLTRKLRKDISVNECFDAVPTWISLLRSEGANVTTAEKNADDNAEFYTKPKLVRQLYSKNHTAALEHYIHSTFQNTSASTCVRENLLNKQMCSFLGVMLKTYHCIPETENSNEMLYLQNYSLGSVDTIKKQVIFQACTL